MSTKKQPGKPEPKNQEGKTSVAKKETIAPLRVEVSFPTIFDLKEGIAFDSDNNLLIQIQFKARVDQYEIFRLVNMLKQPHSALYATIGTPQSAMDFKFTKDGKVEIVKAQVQSEKPKLEEAKKPESVEPAVKINLVQFNHIPEDEKPFGVLIEYVNGTGEIKSIAGRGMSATEAVIAGVKNCGIAADMEEPFEIRAALEKLEPSPELYKLIRVIDVGTFDADEGKKTDTKGE